MSASKPKNVHIKTHETRIFSAFFKQLTDSIRWRFHAKYGILFVVKQRKNTNDRNGRASETSNPFGRKGSVD